MPRHHGGNVRPGRLLRQQMADDVRESPGRVAERVAMRQAGELAVKAREAKFPTLTAALEDCRASVAGGNDATAGRIRTIVEKALR